MGSSGQIFLLAFVILVCVGSTLHFISGTTTPRSTADTAIEDVPDDFECPEAPECESRRTLKALWPEAHLETFDARECCESHAVLRELYAESVAFFARHNLTYFVTSGSLLGLMRHEHHVVPWEKDGDLTVVWDRFPQTYAEHEERVKLFMRFNDESKVARLSRCQAYDGLCRIAFKVRHRFKKAKIHVDWFQVAPPEPSLGRFVRNSSVLVRMNKSWTFFRHRREWILPTQTCPVKLFGIENLQCPNDIESVLRYEYGDDWRVGRTGRVGITTNTSIANHDYWNLYYKRPAGWNQKPSGLEAWGDGWLGAHTTTVPWAHCSLHPSQWCRFKAVRTLCNDRRRLSVPSGCNASTYAPLIQPILPPIVSQRADGDDTAAHVLSQAVVGEQLIADDSLREALI